MKTVKIFSIAILSSFIIISCKKGENPIPETATNNDLAIVKTTAPDEITNPTYLYVTASTGLSLRAYANLHSDKLAIMPYGTKVRVIEPEVDPTMNIGGIKGGMDAIEFNHKKGYAFNGYLSKFFPPEQDITAKGYAQELGRVYPKVSYKEFVEGTVSQPINREVISLPTQNWHEAYYIAKELYNIPSDLPFPGHKGNDTQIIKDKKPKKNIWTSQLETTRKDDQLQKIEYVYKTKGFTKTISIVKEAAAIKITNLELVK